jgi:hypothetical protein
MKLCSRCCVTKPISGFHRSNKTKDGVTAHCKVCERLRVKTYRAANPEKALARARSAYAKNPEKSIERSKVWRLEHPDRARELKKNWQTANKEQERLRRRAIFEANKEDELKAFKERMEAHHAANPKKELARKKEWKRNNKDKVNAQNAKRRAARQQAAPAWLTAEHLTQIKLFYTAAQECLWFTNESLHVDHIVPLLGKDVCGLHVPWNLQVLPASENEKKNNKFDCKDSGEAANDTRHLRVLHSNFEHCG